MCSLSYSQTISTPVDSIIVGEQTGCGISYTAFVPPRDLPTINPLYGGIVSDSFDIDGDGYFDFTLSYSKSSVFTLGSKEETSRVFAGDSTFIAVAENDTILADSLNLHDIVNKGKKWAKTAYLYNIYWQQFGTTQEMGYWKNKSYYIGVKIVNGAKIRYGWVNIDLNSLSEFAMSDSCQTPVYIEQIVISPNPSPDFINIETNSLNTAIAELFDSTGKYLFSTTWVGKTIFDVRDLNKGLYLLSIKLNNKMINKKIVVTN